MHNINIGVSGVFLKCMYYVKTKDPIILDVLNMRYFFFFSLFQVFLIIKKKSIYNYKVKKKNRLYHCPFFHYQ